MSIISLLEFSMASGRIGFGATLTDLIRKSLPQYSFNSWVEARSWVYVSSTRDYIQELKIISIFYFYRAEGTEIDTFV